jgi:dTDP-3-amino-3,4,6-trideoxy-alpha-D-glucose transaminase
MPTPIPIVNLKPALQATEAGWRARLDELFREMQFILGRQGQSFEHEFAQAMGARHAVGVGNGTDAITLCLQDAGVTHAEDEVLTTALTAPFTGVGIVAAGARIRFADVDPHTLQIDPVDAGRRVTRRTRALVVVHLYGQPCRLNALAAIARGAGLVLIQDAAQAHGARYRGKHLASFSPYVTYSFYPTKNLGCLGDGGAITTNRAALNRSLRQRRDGGRKNTEQVARLPGLNSRLDEIQACYLRAFLPRLEEWNLQRAQLARLYDEALADCPGIQLVRRENCSVHHLYVIRARRRAALRRYLADQGIGSAVHYPVPLHLMPAFAAAGLRRGDLPHAERAAREVLSLPLWPGLPSSVLRVADAIRRFYR